MPGPVARAERTFGALARSVLMVLLCCLLCTCTSPARLTPPAPPAPPPTTTSSGTEGATSESADQSALNALAAAIRADDRTAFNQLVSRRDPAFLAVARRIFDNLSALPLVGLSFRIRSTNVQLTPARRVLLGSDVAVHAVDVSWRLTGDTGSAQHQLWLTFLRSGTLTLLAGTTDGPRDRVAQPLWMLEPIVGEQLGSTTVLAPPGGAVTAWSSRGNQAVAAISPRLPSTLRSRWNGQLVVEVPSTLAVFEQLLGVTPGSYAQIAAVAWPEGPVAATAALRIVVNPELAERLDGQGPAILLAHEATHIATRSAASPAPTWVVEGFADYVAYDAYPRTAPEAAAALLAHVAAGTAPTQFPLDAAFSPTAPDLNLSYAASWLACRFVAETFGANRLDRFYADVDGGSSVDEASRRVFGRSQSELAGAWGHYLRTLAQRR